MSNAVLDIVSKGLYHEEEILENVEEMESTGIGENIGQEDKVKKGVITIEDELKFFEIVKEYLVEDNKDISNLKYKSTTNYFSVFNGTANKWFVRIVLESSKPNIMFKLEIDEVKDIIGNNNVEKAPKGIGNSRILIDGIQDVSKYKDVIVKAFLET